MTEKILNTRLQLKYDTLDNWNAGDQASKTGKYYVLKKGEVGICAININSTATNPSKMTPPQIMFKVGDGVTEFQSLPWASAMAADVADWAKAASKPTYALYELSGIGESLRFVKAENNTYKLQYALKSDPSESDWTTVTNFQISEIGDLSELSDILAGQDAQTLARAIALVGQRAEDNYDKIDASKTLSTNSKTIIPAINELDTEIGNLSSLSTNTKTDLVTAINEVRQAVQSGGTNAVITVEKQTTPTAGSQTTYVIKQGGEAVAGEKIEIPVVPDVPDVEVVAKTVTDDQDQVYVVNNLTASEHKITPSYTVVPTKEYVDKKVTGAVNYLGTVASMNDLSNLVYNETITITAGDFCRASESFSFGRDGGEEYGPAEDVHAGDILIAKQDSPDYYWDYWEVIHTEDTVWTANSKDSAGYVAKGEGQANKVWKTDADGNPSWRLDQNTKYRIGASDSADSIDGSGWNTNDNGTCLIQLIALDTYENDEVDRTLDQNVQVTSADSTIKVTATEGGTGLAKLDFAINDEITFVFDCGDAFNDPLN